MSYFSLQHSSRLPTSLDSLQLIRNCGVEIHSVLDVGVQYKTEPLLRVFPDLKHHLFEPVDLFFARIEEAYEGLEYELHHIAVSDEDGQAWQVCLSSDHSGAITHSQIQFTPDYDESKPNFVEIRPVPRKTLNTWVAEFRPQSPYLLKVDVDGHDLKVLKGAEELFKETNVVIVEAPVTALLERANYLAKQGFRLFDIVDFAYYGGSLWQVDLVFLPERIIKYHPKLCRSPAGHIDWSLWSSLTRELEMGSPG